MPTKIIYTRIKRKPGAGRKPLSPEGSVTLNVRLTPVQRACVDAMGGGAWLRGLIDQHHRRAKRGIRGREQGDPTACAPPGGESGEAGGVEHG